MPRRARIAVAGVPWHITQRGNNRTDCFLRAKDYIKFLDILTQSAADCGCKVHAYVLMSNHTHLLVTPSEIDSAANLMKHLGQRYVQYFDRTHKRSGTLWVGLYMGLGKTNSERRHEYRARFHARLDDRLIGTLRRATNGNYVSPGG